MFLNETSFGVYQIKGVCTRNQISGFASEVLQLYGLNYPRDVSLPSPVHFLSLSPLLFPVPYTVTKWVQCIANVTSLSFRSHSPLSRSWNCSDVIGMHMKLRALSCFFISSYATSLIRFPLSNLSLNFIITLFNTCAYHVLNQLGFIAAHENYKENFKYFCVCTILFRLSALSIHNPKTCCVTNHLPIILTHYSYICIFN